MVKKKEMLSIVLKIQIHQAMRFISRSYHIIFPVSVIIFTVLVTMTLYVRENVITEEVSLF